MNKKLCAGFVSIFIIVILILDSHVAVASNSTVILEGSLVRETIEGGFWTLQVDQEIYNLRGKIGPEFRSGDRVRVTGKIEAGMMGIQMKGIIFSLESIENVKSDGSNGKPKDNHAGMKPESIPEPAYSEIADPVAEFIKFNDPTDSPGVQLMRIQKDFNFDGVTDVAVSASSYFGNGGGPWWLFIGLKDGKYKLLKGDFSFHPRGYKLIKKTKGVGILRGCWHMSAEQCNPFEYTITSDGVSAVPKNKLSPNQDLYKSFDPSLSYQTCDLAEFKKDKNRAWVDAK